MDIGLLILRLAVGLVMVYHGTEKLFGWWGADGLKGAAAFFGRMGYRPPLLMAAVAGLAETAGGLLLAAGALTPLAVLMLAGTFANIVILHLPNGLSRRRNGFEYELVLLAATCCLAFTGPGALAVDALLGLSLAGATWGAVLVGAGLLAGVIVSASRTGKVSAGPAGAP
ncbi:DoxX family protein [Nonomuraea sp. NPDC059023]|uniref:DoxX family protein n=1 Tax=unclassified Nonomuraea TaxID=2593643 RepID=UPI00369145A3